MSCEGIQGPFRGGTVRFAVNFYDIDGALTQPASAVINIVYPTAAGESATVQLPLSSPAGAETRWTAIFDTRDIGPGVVFYSVHSEGGPPFGVDDGRFSIEANAANLATF